MSAAAVRADCTQERNELGRTGTDLSVGILPMLQKCQLRRWSGEYQLVDLSYSDFQRDGPFFQNFNLTAELEYGSAVHAGIFPTKNINYSKSKIQIM
jgi:hypothetical protein